MAHRRHNSSFQNALPPYIGRKTRLLPLLFAALNGVVPRAKWSSLRFLDPMAGSGAVALQAKAHGFSVVSNDASAIGSTVGTALIANNTAKLVPGHIAALLAGGVVMDGPATAFVPGVFTAAQASWIDSALAAADGFSEPIRSLLRLVIIRVVLHLQPMSMLDGTDAWRVSAGEFDAISPRRLGHYLRADQALTPAAVERIAQAVNQGVIGGRGACRHGDAVEVVAAEQADILYCDPPYPGTTGYRDPYAPLRLLLGDSMAEQPASLEALLEAAAHIPVALISYGGRGVTLDTLVAAVSLHRRVVRAIEVPFPHLRSLARKEVSDANREFIVVAVR